MAKGIKGLPVAYSTIGGLMLWSGLKGSTIKDTLQSVLGGIAPQKGSQTIGTPSVGVSSGTGSTSTSGSTSATPSNGSESAWITAFLAALGAPDTAANRDSMTDWISHEGPWGSVGQNNPLDTTQSGFNATGDFNSVGVKNYPTAADGAAATVATINNGLYPDIIAQLRAGAGLKSGASAGLSKWSGGGYTSV